MQIFVLFIIDRVSFTERWLAHEHRKEDNTYSEYISLLTVVSFFFTEVYV
jgi:hypothetical protein